MEGNQEPVLIWEGSPLAHLLINNLSTYRYFFVECDDHQILKDFLKKILQRAKQPPLKKNRGYFEPNIEI